MWVSGRDHAVHLETRRPPPLVRAAETPGPDGGGSAALRPRGDLVPLLPDGDPALVLLLGVGKGPVAEEAAQRRLLGIDDGPDRRGDVPGGGGDAIAALESRLGPDAAEAAGAPGDEPHLGTGIGHLGLLRCGHAAVGSGERSSAPKKSASLSI